jgi:uncharacterized delta-60 repeat protein
MSGQGRSKQRVRGAGSLAVVGALGVAIVSFCPAALGSNSARGSAVATKSVDLGRALAAGRAGEVVVAGLSNGRQRTFALARYTADGRLDRRFGVGGMTLTSFGAKTSAGADALSIRPDGKTVVAGWAVVPPRIYSGFAIARYTRAGKLDRTFGRRGNVVTYFGGRKTVSSALGVASQRDGKVVAVGFASGWPSGGRTTFALARYTRQGTLDPSFGRGGKVVTDFGVHASAATVAIQRDGKIVVAGGGRVSDRARSAFALARYHPDGRLDRRFGNRGRVLTAVGEFDTEAVALIVQPDRKLVAAGNALVAGDTGFALVRYTPDGKLDSSFGDDGQAFNGAGSVSDLTIQRDGKLVTAGVGMRRYPAFSLARFLEDGSLDSSFGRGGNVQTAFHRTARAYAVVVRTDGKIVAAGAHWGRDFALACYTGSGRLARGFGKAGKALTDFAHAWAANPGN